MRQPGFLTLTLGGDVASCALDPERRIVAVVGGPEKRKTHVTLLAVERERITKWGELEISGARAHLVDHPTLGCERGAAVLAWNAGDQVHAARCTQRGCESQQGKAKIDTLRPLAAAGSTVVLVDTSLDATRGAPIVLRAGPVSSVENGPARVLAVDASRGGPLAPGHELHVASTGGAVWIVSAPRRELGPLIAFRVDAGGRIAAVRPERPAR